MPEHNHPWDVGGDTYSKATTKQYKDNSDIDADLNTLKKCREEPNPPVFVLDWTGPTGIVEADIVYRDGMKHFIQLKPELSKSQKQRTKKKQNKTIPNKSKTKNCAVAEKRAVIR